MATGSIRESISPDELRGRAAVITGGANGIGLATAKRLAALDMKVCIADADANALAAAKDELSSLVPEGSLLVEEVDVSDFSQVEGLADRAYEAFGEVALLMNNAGISGNDGMKPWEDSWGDVIDINFMGMVNGVRAFTERMMAQELPSAIVNVGSKQGITTPPGNAAYNAAKAAVKVLSEQLAYELRQIDGCTVSAHMLIPGWTFTGINSSAPITPENKPDGAWSADQVSEFLLDGLERGDFYILCPDNSVTREMDERRIAWAAGDIIENRPALSRWHPQYADAFEESMKGVEKP